MQLQTDSGRTDNTVRVVKVAVDAPLATVFDYLPDTKLLPPIGSRVFVPFGKGRRCGVVVAHAAQSAVPDSRLRPVAEVLDGEPLLDAEHLDFLGWAADYYHHPLGEVVGASLPVRLRRGEPVSALGEPGWALTAAGVVVDPASCRRAPRQGQVLAELRRQGGRIGHRTLVGSLGDCAGPLRALRAKGWIEACVFEAAAPAPIPAESGPQLTAEQEQALAEVKRQLTGFAAFLLEGVTGSGKTEVYLRLASAVLAHGGSVLVLVPEIALTPQLLRRFTRRFGDGVAVLHSGLAERERETAWQRARLGRARLVIGTRSAVLGPVAGLGLVIVDEEHDPSFKQQDGFRYSARDLAVIRARRARDGVGCPVILGSATPSLESLRNVGAGRFSHLRLHRRPGAAALPSLALVDVRDQPLEGGMSRVLLGALDRALTAGEQCLVFLNRRGFAPVLSCWDCGWLSECPRCDARQTLHARSGLLWCHHCGAQRRTPTRCPHCGGAELHPLGQGTQRLEETLSLRFPDVRMIRIDRDATRRKGSLEDLLEQARTSGPALLVGTQMLAKGHHLPRVTLVGVLDVDGGLFSADFRAAERVAQLLIQVAGRAGRGDSPGRVLIQTRYPEHPLLQTLVRDGYAAFATAALAEREAAGLPPFAFQALVRAEAATPQAPGEFLGGVADLVAGLAVPGVDAWGPVPAPMERKAGRYRAHLLLQATQRAPLHRLLDQLLPAVRALRAARRVRWSLDVDPSELV